MPRFHIAGLSIPLHDLPGARRRLAEVYAQFAERTAAYVADPANPHLCRAGCSGCCRSGALFAVTLVEAVALAEHLDAGSPDRAAQVRREAAALHALQVEVFTGLSGEPDAPGARTEPAFPARVAVVNRAAHPSCPLLDGDLCGAYDGRPFLCRAYGLPVDAFAVKSGDALAFRSLCRLYEGAALRDYVRARDLRDELRAISQDLAGGRDPGRFTSAEALLARLE